MSLVRFEGTRNVESNFMKSKNAIIRKLGFEIENVGREVQRKAQQQTPLLTGGLKKSAQTSSPKITAGTGSAASVSVTVSLRKSNGGANVAEIQHRRKDFKHPRSGKAGYLRDPLMATGVSLLPKAIGRAVAGGLNRGV